MDLITAEPFQLVGVERLAECLLADQGPVRQFLFTGLEPRQYLAFEEAAQAGDIGGDEVPVFLQFVRVAGQFVERTSAWATAAATGNRGYHGSMARRAFVHRSPQ